MYPFDSSDPPSHGVIRDHYVDARVYLIQELTHAKRRGMDGFHFELCSVHSTMKPECPEVVFEELACLDRYPGNCTLAKRSGHRILPSKQLDLWYPAEGMHSSEASASCKH